MRATLLVLLITVIPAFADDLSITLIPNFGVGAPPAIAPDPDPPCSLPGCVLFTGTLQDNDSDDSYIFLSNVDPTLPNISVTFSSGPASGGLTIDNTFDDLPAIPGVLVGDSNSLADFGLPNSYSGPLFGIDIAPGTTQGIYTGTVTIFANGGTDDPGNAGFSVSQEITVEVAPEPGGAILAVTGLIGLAAWFGWKRRLRDKWRSSAVSR
jgi:hypothetical protein